MWALEARVAAMHVTMRAYDQVLHEVIARHNADREEQALVEIVRKMTEEFFGSPVGVRKVEDPGESPYTTLVVRVGAHENPADVAQLHERWHDALASTAPEAVGRVRLNLAFE